MISVHIMGGLGNQLFQIFFLIAYSWKYNKSFYFSNKKILSNRTDRYSYWDSFFKNLESLTVSDSIIESLPIVQECNFRFFDFPDLGDNFKFYGYFQSYKYFENYRDKIINFLSINEQREQIDFPYEFEKTVSLHFRIGDYKDLQHFHPICTLQYYIRCLEILSKDHIDYQIIYFNEEQDSKEVDDKINKMRLLFPQFQFINERRKTDFEELLAMSRCKHHIIANSSFSWWGAYLSDEKASKNFYPDVWFGPQTCGIDISDLCPPAWKKIKT